MKLKIVMAIFVLLLGVGTMAYAWGQLSEADQIYGEGNAAYEELGRLVRARGFGANAPAGASGADASDAGVSVAADASGANAPAGAPGADAPGAGPSGAGPSGDDAGMGFTGPGGGNLPAGADGLPGAGQQAGPEAQAAKVYIPDAGIDFEALYLLNGDAAAWLYCPDTAIDYPVLKADDYNYYLHHLPDGTHNANGALFIDFNNAPDFSEPLTVIYGHHMKNGSMFGSLSKYKEQAYYDGHPYMYLYTQHGNYRLDLLYGCVIGAEQWRERAFMYKENLDPLITYAAHNTTFSGGAAYAEGDKVVVMSTCSYEFEEARYVVIGVLTAEY